ncbi:MAG: hypothetical protein Kow0010_13770 [Dehalococcoidia bacterium]
MRRIVEDAAQALDADAPLRPERGRADNDAAAEVGVHAEQGCHKVRGDLVLPRLARIEDGECGAAVPGDPPKEACERPRLVIAKDGRAPMPECIHGSRFAGEASTPERGSAR